MASRKTTTHTITNPTVGELQRFLEALPRAATGVPVRVSVYKGRPFDPEETTISVTYVEVEGGQG